MSCRVRGRPVPLPGTTGAASPSASGEQCGRRSRSRAARGRAATSGPELGAGDAQRELPATKDLADVGPVGGKPEALDGQTAQPGEDVEERDVALGEPVVPRAPEDDDSERCVGHRKRQCGDGLAAGPPSGGGTTQPDDPGGRGRLLVDRLPRSRYLHQEVRAMGGNRRELLTRVARPGSHVRGAEMTPSSSRSAITRTSPPIPSLAPAAATDTSCSTPTSWATAAVASCSARS